MLSKNISPYPISMGSLKGSYKNYGSLAALQIQHFQARTTCTFAFRLRASSRNKNPLFLGRSYFLEEGLHTRPPTGYGRQSIVVLHHSSNKYNRHFSFPKVPIYYNRFSGVCVCVRACFRSLAALIYEQ